MAVDRGSFWRVNSDLLLIILFCLLTGAVIYLPLIQIARQPLSALCGLGFVFFIPGYVTLAALYPHQDESSAMKRFFASFGISVIVSGLISLILVYVTGLNVDMGYGALSLWVVIMLLFAGVRRSKLPELRIIVPDSAQVVASTGDASPRIHLDDGLQAALGLTILLVLLAAGRLWWATYQKQPVFSEFYVMGRNGLLGEYTETFVPGEPLTLMAGVISHLPENTSYRIYASVDEGEQLLMEQFTLADGDRWQEEITIPIDSHKQLAKVSLWLFAGDLIEPVHTLHLWLEPIE